MVRVRLWDGEELSLQARNLKELLLCLRKIREEKVKRYVREDGSPTPLLLVFVNGVERSALTTEELEEGDLVELFPVLHRG